MRVVALSLIAAAVLAFAPGAAAATLTCGQTITQDTVLDNDLLNCPGDGIRIDADNVTLDLSGHVVDGNRSLGGTGVQLYDASDGSAPSGVTVKNGTIRQFGVGVVVLHDNNALRSVTLDSNGRGVFVSQAYGTVIANNTISGSTEDGIVLDWVARDGRITGNSITGNRNGIFSAVPLINARPMRNVVTRNRIVGNREDGLHFDFAIESTLIEGNVFSGNTDDGIDLVNGVDPQRLGANSAIGNGDLGIAVASPGGATLATNLGGNQAQGNGNAAQCTGFACDGSGRLLFGSPVHGDSFSQMSSDVKRASPFAFAYGGTSTASQPS